MQSTPLLSISAKMKFFRKKFIKTQTFEKNLDIYYKATNKRLRQI